MHNWAARWQGCRFRTDEGRLFKHPFALALVGEVGECGNDMLLLVLGMCVVAKTTGLRLRESTFLTQSNCCGLGATTLSGMAANKSPNL